MKEEDIRPVEIFNKYLQLAKEDCINFFNGEAKNEFKCPVHQHAKCIDIFTKHGFSYKECEICSSIFVSPRHDLSVYEDFYLNGNSVKFWSKEFYKKTEEARKSKLWRPKVEDLSKSKFLDFSIDKYSIIDIGGGYGAFAEIIKEKNPKNIYVIEPNRELANICRNKGIKVIEKFSHELKDTDLPKGPKIITSFELFEHLYDPKEFIISLRRLMDKGDILYMTTLTSSGLDIKELKKESKAINPPYHINFLSVKGIEEFLINEKFTSINISTPGKLDMDIIRNQKNSIKNELLITIIENFCDQSLKDFQNLIAKNKMSSHMLIEAKL